MASTSNSPAVAGAGALQILYVLRNADMQSTADQQFSKVFSGTYYFSMRIIARRVTGGATDACTGGIYDAASKAGTQLAASGHSWLALAENVNVGATPTTMNLLSATPYLSLTTGSTAACTADIFIVGFCLD